jgi:hypothetical protein
MEEHGRIASAFWKNRRRCFAFGRMNGSNEVNYVAEGIQGVVPPSSLTVKIGVVTSPN